MGNEMVTVEFSEFGLEGYRRFLACKRLPEFQLDFAEDTETYRLTTPARFGHIIGITETGGERGDLEYEPFLWDYQRAICRVALGAKRFAVWADCGLGKTLIFLEFARHVVYRTGGRVLILSPLQIIAQTMEEAQRFYGEYRIERLDSRADLERWCVEGEGVAITNYEKMIAGVCPEMRHCAGLIADESSILKTGGGVIKWNLVKSARGIEYKMSCTATPAPNDVMEYASQAAFLEKLRNEGEILWTWFVRDKSGEWRIRPHALDAFYRFMSGWSIYLHSPVAYGFKDNVKAIPEPVILNHVVAPTEDQSRFETQHAMEATGDMFASERMGIELRSKLSQAAKGFYYTDDGAVRIDSEKPRLVARIVREELAAGLQVLVWTVFDEEGEIIAEDLGGVDWVAILSGKTPQKRRTEIIEDFRKGRISVLISKAKMLGYGINFQNCGSMIFSGWNDSFEQWYQAIRRAFRYGQTRRLRVHVPCIESLEGKMLQNVMGKAARFDSERRIQEGNYLKAMKETGLM